MARTLVYQIQGNILPWALIHNCLIQRLASGKGVINDDAPKKDTQKKPTPANIEPSPLKKKQKPYRHREEGQHEPRFIFSHLSSRKSIFNLSTVAALWIHLSYQRGVHYHQARSDHKETFPIPAASERSRCLHEVADAPKQVDQRDADSSRSPSGTFVNING
jgi:hypothetical protein